MKKCMPSYNSSENSKSEPAETNMTVLELILLFFIIVLILANGINYLDLEPATSELSDIQDEAFGIYNRHRMQFDQLSKQFNRELVSANKKIKSSEN